MGSQQSSRLQATREQASEKQTTTELDFIFKRPIFWRPSYIAQSAWLEHIPFAFWLVDTLRPRKIVELGTHYGSSYFSFCQAVTKLDLITRCYAVDTWGGDEHAGQYGEEVYGQVFEHNHQHYSDFSTLVRSTFDQALEQFPQGSIDLLHIDGLHTLEAVRHDFESWLPKLSDKAVVIMHDTNVRERGFGVFQLLDELKQQYPHFEFTHGYGLGVIGVGSEQIPEMLSLYGLSENGSATRQVQEVFSRLGKACGHSWENGEIKRQIIALQDTQQAETQEVMEQQALERGRLAERITAQHHALQALEDKLAQSADQSAELINQQQQTSALTAELTLLKQHAAEVQTALNQSEQQRDQGLDNQQKLETTLAETQQKVAQIVAECDELTQEKRSLLEQQTEAQAQQGVMQQQVHEQALQLEKLTVALTAANQQQDELSQTLATEASHWQQQQQTLTNQCDSLTTDLASSRAMLEQYETAQQVWQTHEQELKGTLNAQAGEITNLNQTLAKKNITIDKQSVELEQIRDQIARMEHQKEVEQVEHQHQLSNLKNELDERYTEIATLTGWLEEREQILSIATSEHQKIREEHQNSQQTWRDMQLQYQTEQTEHQQQLSELKHALSERFAEIAALTGWLEEREQLLEKSANEYRHATQEHHLHQQAWQTEQQQLISNAEQAVQQQTNLNQQISDLVKHNERLDANIAERFRELAVMTNLIEQQARELKNGEQQTEQLKVRINKLKGTVSWRLTAPVRALAKPFKGSSKYSVSQINIISESGFFDEQWYRQQYPDSLTTSSAIEHYLNIGAKNSYNPSPEFDTNWYLNTYPDVANGEVNPLLHYILHGQHEGRLCRSQS